MERHSRTEMLVGAATMERYRATRAILFGVGGVGSWCAEGLIRSGIGHLTIVDRDIVAESNINRQLMATTATVGQSKVEALKAHLLDINPDADIVALQKSYSADSAADFDLDVYDYVVDAIDSLADKMELIINCTQKGLPFTFFSSMGAALKMDPTQVRVSEFWEVDGCPLAATLRRRMRRQKRYPGRKFRCVWSPEVIRTEAKSETAEATAAKGSMVHVTAVVGFTLAGLILQDIKKKQS